jgi:GMP synthase-like glutamine amidotransferase
MRIGILKADETPPELIKEHGTYDGFYVRLLSDHGFDFAIYPVFEGKFPASVRKADGWIITGAAYSANDPYPWVERLKDFIRKIYRRGQPLVGFCFGHQVVAAALGGVVEPSPEGWRVGPVEYRRGGKAVQRVIAWHREQVAVRPPEARVIGSTEGCENAMLAYGPSVRTYQCHPELSSVFARGLLHVHRDDIPATMASNVLEARDETLQHDELEAEIVAFLKSAIGTTRKRIG